MNYEQMTVKELKEEVKRRRAQNKSMICAYSNLRKDELIQALKRNDSGETTLDRIRKAYYSDEEIKEMKKQKTTRGDKNK